MKRHAFWIACLFYFVSTGCDGSFESSHDRADDTPGSSKQQDAAPMVATSSHTPGLFAPTVSEAIDIDAPAPAAVVRSQRSPAVATDGTSSLIVWQDTRDGNKDIYAARLDANGNMLDKGGIAICTHSRDQSLPQVAFDGTNFLVVWDDARNGRADVYGARVDTSGNVLDPDGFVISDADQYQRYPVVAFDGTNYLVVWTDNRNGNTDIYGARVDTSGNVLDADGLLLDDSSSYQTTPAIAFDGTNYLVVWADELLLEWNIRGRRISPAGVSPDPAAFDISAAPGMQANPAVAFDGTNFLTLWQDDRNGDKDIYATRVDTNGTALDAGGVAISTGAGDQQRPAVAFNGTHYLAAWQDGRGTDPDIWGARVDTSATVLDPNGIVLAQAANFQNNPAVVAQGADFVVAWDDERVPRYDIYATRVDSTGGVTDPNGILMSVATDQPSLPVIAFDGTNFLTVWGHYRNGGYDMWGARIAPDGTVLDPDGILISNAPRTQFNCAIAFDGTNYLVVWDDYRNGRYRNTDIYAARIAPDGTVLDPGGFPITNATDNQKLAQVAFDGTHFVVVWSDARSGTGAIYAARVDPDGTVVDTDGIALTDGSASASFPDLACDGATGCLVAWQDQRNGPSNYDIYAARLDLAGTVLDPAGIPLAQAPGMQRLPDLTFDGTNYLVVWADRQSDEDDLVAARIDTTGAFVDQTPFDVSTAAGNQIAPNIAFDGNLSLVFWQDGRAGNADIYAARIDTNGTVLDPQGVAIADSARPEEWPSAVAYGSNEFVVTYRHETPAGPGIGAVEARFVSYEPSVPVAHDAIVETDEDSPLAITLTADDASGAPLTFTVVTEPTSGALSGDAPDLTYTPDEHFHGQDTFTFVANNGTADSEEATVTIEVHPVDDAPTFVAPTPDDQATLTSLEGESIVLELAAEDADGDTLTFDASPMPDGAAFDATTGAFAWTPNEEDAGTYPLTLSVSDGTLTDERTVTLEIAPLDEGGEDVGGSADTGTDVGTDVGDASQSTEQVSSAGEGCSCNAAGSGGPVDASVLFLLVLGVWARRRTAR